MLAALTSLPQQRNERMRHPGSSDNVPVEHPAPFIVSEPLDRPKQLDANVGHDEIRCAETLFDCVRSSIDAPSIGHIGQHAQSFYAMYRRKGCGFVCCSIGIEIK